ncbi:hypothetical protein IQ244_23555 [Nostoc sp. LEGE 06077]|uniref:hypothetical protein n=1 Tax=Nostoc sp. LEGE 06077 TaxID=915325 RepID=UPI00187EF02D|nr:hypothetical protein [Nostoc sp. LEGE 06077]MBE9209422.1 hypothetical protein [Nostoc sp. LEGE 06077]
MNYFQLSPQLRIANCELRIFNDERWGVIVAFEEAQPQMFEQLVAAAPEWVEWMG